MKILNILTILAIVAVAFNIAQARAESCEGGTSFEGVNGHEYCRSSYKMNWWSAYAWCEAQGRHLASIYEICPDTGEGLNNKWDGIPGTDVCANMIGWRCESCWSSTPYQTDKAFYISGKGSISGVTREIAGWAACY